jgi:drug/metabolite transporter (DMT)-like permease
MRKMGPEGEELKPAQLPPGHFKAEFLLLLITFFWGSSFPVIKHLLEVMSFSALHAWRYLLASFLVIGYCAFSRRWVLKETWRPGIILGFLIFIGLAFQTIGLMTTTASKSAFITSLLVVMVPILSTFVEKRKPGVFALAGVGLAVIGLGLLIQPRGDQVNPGDLWSLLCAFAWTIYIVLLQIESRRFDAYSLFMVQTWTVAFFFSLTAVGQKLLGIQTEKPLFTFPLESWLWLLYLAVAVTILTTLVHTFYQRGTTSTRAALIYMMEPVSASVLAWVALGEVFTPVQFAGAGVILGGILLAEVGPELFGRFHRKRLGA